MTADNKIYLKISTSGLMEFRTLDDRDLNEQIHDEGLLKGLPMNDVASELYGTRIHGGIICGDVLIMREYMDENGERDICGLDLHDCDELINKLHGLIVIKEVDNG